MTAAEYTPTTAAVRSGYAATEHFAAAFDRWLAAHDAEVRAAAADEIERMSHETYAVVLCEHQEAAAWLREVTP